MSGESRIINLKVAGSNQNQRSATPGSRRSSRSNSAMSVGRLSKNSTTRRKRKRIKSSLKGSMKGSSKGGKTKVKAPKRSVNLSMLSSTEHQGK